MKQRQKITLCKEKRQGWNFHVADGRDEFFEPLKNTPHYRWKNYHTDASPEPEAPKESIPMCKPSFFHTKSGQWTELTFFWVLVFWQKVKKEIIYLTPSNKKNPWIRGQIAISFEPGVIPLPKPQIGVTSCEVVIICPERLVCINGSWWFRHVSELIWKKLPTLDPFCRRYLSLGLETKTTTISFLNYHQAKLGGTHFLQQQKLESSHPPHRINGGTFKW